MNKRFYTGIGSRTISDDIRNQMTELAKSLNNDFWLRSGNADGADQAFAEGVEDEKAQIWLPWTSFNKDFKRSHPEHTYKIPNSNNFDLEADESVDKFHPIGSSLVGTSRQFMSRNYRQVRGLNEPDSEFIICWTFDGTDVGGTGQAIRIANHFNIPVFNLYHLNMDEILKEIIKLGMIQ